MKLILIYVVLSILAIYCQSSDVVVMGISNITSCTNVECTVKVSSNAYLELSPGDAVPVFTVANREKPLFTLGVNKLSFSPRILSSYIAIQPRYFYKSLCERRTDGGLLSGACQSGATAQFPTTLWNAPNVFRSGRTKFGDDSVEYCHGGFIWSDERYHVIIVDNWNTEVEFILKNSSGNDTDVIVNVTDQRTTTLSGIKVSVLRPRVENPPINRVCVIYEYSSGKTYVIYADDCNWKGEHNLTKFGWLQQGTKQTTQNQIAEFIKTWEVFKIIDCGVGKSAIQVTYGMASWSFLDTAKQVVPKQDVRVYVTGAWKVNDDASFGHMRDRDLHDIGDVTSNPDDVVGPSAADFLVSGSTYVVTITINSAQNRFSYQCKDSSGNIVASTFCTQVNPLGYPAGTYLKLQNYDDKWAVLGTYYIGFDSSGFVTLDTLHKYGEGIVRQFHGFGKNITSMVTLYGIFDISEGLIGVTAHAFSDVDADVLFEGIAIVKKVAGTCDYDSKTFQYNITANTTASELTYNLTVTAKCVMECHITSQNFNSFHFMTENGTVSFNISVASLTPYSSHYTLCCGNDCKTNGLDPVKRPEIPDYYDPAVTALDSFAKYIKDQVNKFINTNTLLGWLIYVVIMALIALAIALVIGAGLFVIIMWITNTMNPINIISYVLNYIMGQASKVTAKVAARGLTTYEEMQMQIKKAKEEAAKKAQNNKAVTFRDGSNVTMRPNSKIVEKDGKKYRVEIVE